jgi:hypothetical protein
VYADVLTVETIHEDFGGGVVDCEEERGMRDERDPFNKSLCCKGCFYCIVLFIVGICETRDGKLETCHFWWKTKARRYRDSRFAGYSNI